ncbi:hypothetical protein DL98DRAFT_511731 [Cadophora sp. DSE1049]|nr:hypothetical protein DL98DRAFT_511731 [Cadophora sp. DSE1049]
MASQIVIRYAPPVPQVLTPRRAISRSRTGCGTCRLRKKKCDEAAGTECNNCRKGNLRCTGYPARTEWNGGRQRRRSTRQRPPDQPAFNQTNALPEADHREPSQGDVDFGYFLHSTPPSEEVASFDDGMMVNGDINYIDTDISYPQFGEDFTFPEDMSHFTEMEPQSSLPFELSHIIIGVDTPLQRRLFDHFYGATSRVLTTSNGIANPFNSIVLPLAIRDETMMKLLLSLAGSQLLRRYPAGWEQPELEQETTRLHQEARKEQLERARILEEQYPEHPHEYKDRDLEVVFTTYLLLCLYEICEGSGDGSGNENLSWAGKTIALASTTPQDAIGPLPLRFHLRARIHPFLLEFYYYHVFLASVTVPSAPIIVPQYDQITDLIGQDRYLVGVQDGLIDFIARISALRNDVDNNDGELDGSTTETALKIFAELEAWQPQATSSRPEQLVASFYQMALYIWLFSIVNPDHSDHDKVQLNVTRIVAGMCEIRECDGVMACMLFPLFVAGSAALKQEDRNLIITHFATLKKWSALGNIDLTFKVVKRMWEHQAAGVKSSWNWVEQLKDSHMSLLVT